jgi:anti-sigma regulatory factor (Ser/Thr protein kinase)
VFQLALTRARMLADIGAGESALGLDPLRPDDPGFLERDPVRLVVRANHRTELFGELEHALRRRFVRGSSEHLWADLLLPLRKAIGNSHRRGNKEDPSKWLVAEVVATSRGAVVSVTDEGDGFDFERVIRQFEHHEHYFTREGHGIAYFARIGSLVSYADGGRTWLLRYLCDPEPGEPLSAGAGAKLGPAADSTFMQSFLAEHVPSFRDRGFELDTCRVYSVSREVEASELAYVVRCHAGDQAQETQVLTARLLPEAAARADVEIAEHLRAAGVGAAGGMTIPPPLGAFWAPLLSLSLFRLDPSVTLRERIKKALGLGPLAAIMRLVAIGLAAFHLSNVAPEVVEDFDDILQRLRNAKERVEARFAGKPGQARAGACFERLLGLAAGLEPCAKAPIHGALEWECIVAAREGWELYRFDRSRLSHPGVDVGMFLADLWRFHNVRSKGDPALGEAARVAFLESYFEHGRPPWSRDVDWFVACALLERLERVTRRDEAKWEGKVEPILDEVERALGRSSSSAS